jgi:hypothetical protein
VYVPDNWMKKNRLWFVDESRGEGKGRKVQSNLAFFLLNSRGSLGADFSCDNDDESPQLSDVDNVAGWMDGWMDEPP